MFLGSTSHGRDLDMWSFGCVAGELHSGMPLIAPGAVGLQQTPRSFDFVDAIACQLGLPGDADWLGALPFFERRYGQPGKKE